MEKFEAEEALKIIECEKITHSQWVPTMFIRMLKLPDQIRTKYVFSSIKYAIHAAAPCPISIKQKMINWWGPIIHEYYSGTEKKFFATKQYAEASRFKHMKELLEEIKKILEK